MRSYLIAVFAAVCLATSAIAAPASAVNANVVIANAESLDEIMSATDYRASDGDILRLYQAFFERLPDVPGAIYWIGVARDGATLDEIAEWFTDSREFANTYAGTTDRRFLETVYAHVLGRDYDVAGFDYWLGLMGHGLSRGGVVRWVAANDEFVARYPFAPEGEGPPTYVTITDDSGSISMRVPLGWDDVDGSAWRTDLAGNGYEVIGPKLIAAPDIDAWRDSWGTPGVFVAASPMLDLTVEELLDAKAFPTSCTLDGRYDYDDGLYTGLYDYYVDCGPESATLYQIAVEPADRTWIGLVQIVALTDADFDAADVIVDSFIINPGG